MTATAVPDLAPSRPEPPVACRARRRVLIVSENTPVPSDRRVWNIARSLVGAGWEVVVIAAAGADRENRPHQWIDGVEIHRYALRPAHRAPEYAREYLQAMARIRRLARTVSIGARFDIVHACNPPDSLLLAVRSLARDGTRFVFDHHDLVPELLESKYGRADGVVHRATVAVERLAFRLADVSLATNDSYAWVAVERGRMDPADVFVVRNGPDLARFRPVPSDPDLKRGHRHLLAYLGIMGPQDGVDHAVRALAWLYTQRQDWHAIFVGDGDSLPSLRSLADELGLGDQVEFAGWRGDADICRILSSADVCIAPDPPSPLNDMSTMIKVPEYMAMGRAIASYAIPESVVSAGDAAEYAESGQPDALGVAIDRLLADPARRREMGRIGFERVRRTLSWQRSEAALLEAYDRALTKPQASRGRRGLRPPEDSERSGSKARLSSRLSLRWPR